MLGFYLVFIYTHDALSCFMLAVSVAVLVIYHLRIGLINISLNVIFYSKNKNSNELHQRYFGIQKVS